MQILVLSALVLLFIGYIIFAAYVFHIDGVFNKARVEQQACGRTMLERETVRHEMNAELAKVTPIPINSVVVITAIFAFVLALFGRSVSVDMQSQHLSYALIGTAIIAIFAHGFVAGWNKSGFMRTPHLIEYDAHLKQVTWLIERLKTQGWLQQSRWADESVARNTTDKFDADLYALQLRVARRMYVLKNLESFEAALTDYENVEPSEIVSFIKFNYYGDEPLLRRIFPKQSLSDCNTTEYAPPEDSKLYKLKPLGKNDLTNERICKVDKALDELAKDSGHVTGELKDKMLATHMYTFLMFFILCWLAFKMVLNAVNNQLAVTMGITFVVVIMIIYYTYFG